jgi:hypothetical protein
MIVTSVTVWQSPVRLNHKPSSDGLDRQDEEEEMNATANQSNEMIRNLTHEEIEVTTGGMRYDATTDQRALCVVKNEWQLWMSDYFGVCLN